MTISNFSQFALSRAEIRKIVGGFDDSESAKCKGSCTSRNGTTKQEVPGVCMSRKVKKVVRCDCGENTVTNNCTMS